MTDLEKQLLLATWKAWKELNEIRARDGVPWTHYGKSGVDEDYFCSVVDECEAAIEKATGAPPMPWQPTVDGHTTGDRDGG